MMNNEVNQLIREEVANQGGINLPPGGDAAEDVIDTAFPDAELPPRRPDPARNMLRLLLEEVCRFTSNQAEKLISEEYDSLTELIYWSHEDVRR